MQLIKIHLLSGYLFELCYAVIELGSDVFDAVRVTGLFGKMRDIYHKEWDIQLHGKVFIPFHHAAADVVAAEQKVRARYLYLCALIVLCIGHVYPCVRAQIVGITHGFRLLAHALSSALGADGRTHVFGVSDLDIHSCRDLLREIGCAPSYLFAAVFSIPDVLSYLVLKLS